MAELHEEEVWHVPYTAEQIQASVGKGPMFSEPDENGVVYWVLWDINKSQYVKTEYAAFIGNLDTVQENVSRAENAARNASGYADSASKSADAAKEALSDMQEIVGGKDFHLTEQYLFITGEHPFFSATPYNDYTLAKSNP